MYRCHMRPNRFENYGFGNARMCADLLCANRQAAQEPCQDRTGHSEGEGGDEGQEEVDGWSCVAICTLWQREQGGACVCVSTSRSRILWRIGNTVKSSSFSWDVTLRID